LASSGGSFLWDHFQVIQFDSVFLDIIKYIYLFMYVCKDHCVWEKCNSYL